MCKIKREGVPTHEAAAGSVVRPPGVSGRIPEPTVPCQLPSPCPHGSRARSVCRKLSVPVVCRASVQPLLTECLLGSREHARGRSLSHGSHLPPESLHPEEGGAKWISAPHPFIVLREGHGGGGGRCPWAGGRAGLGSCCFPGTSLMPSGEDHSLPMAVRGSDTTALGGWALMPESRAFRRILITVKIMCVEKTLESPLDCKEIQPVNPKGDQS